MSTYLSGNGTQADPYLIHTSAALAAYLSTDSIVGSYAHIVCNIDCTGVVVAISRDIYGTLFCNGFSIINLTIDSNSFYWNLYVNKANFFNLKAYDATYIIKNNSYVGLFTDVAFIGGSGAGFQFSSSALMFNRCVFNTSLTQNVAYTKATNSYSSLLGGLHINGAVDLRSLQNPYDINNYPALTALPELWIVDGSSPPRVKPQNVSNLVTVYAVKGVTKVSGAVKSRRVRAHAVSDFYQIAGTLSDNNGGYIINCYYHSDSVYITHSDDYGRKIAINKPYVIGDIIHPTTPNGYRYKCTTAGTSAAALPSEPWPTSSNLVSGTAIFTPEPVYKAETFLVVPKLFDLLTGQPV